MRRIGTDSVSFVVLQEFSYPLDLSDVEETIISLFPYSLLIFLFCLQPVDAGNTIRESRQPIISYRRKEQWSSSSCPPLQKKNIRPRNKVET